MLVVLNRRILIGVALAVLAVLFARQLGTVLLPFVLGSALAYFLDPLADRLQRMRMSRAGAVAIIALAYTAGLKNRFFANKVQLNIEAFWWDYRNQQVSAVRNDLDGRTANITQNIGRARIRGVEAARLVAEAQAATA